MAGIPKQIGFVDRDLTSGALYRRVVRSARGGMPVWARMAGGFSLVLWFAIGAAGRAIGAI